MDPLATEVFSFDGRDITLSWFAGNPDPSIKVGQCSAYCLYQGKLVIVRNKRGWGIPGGHPEEGESMTDALARELEEEAGIKKWSKIEVIGWMKVVDPMNEDRERKEIAQVRFFVILNDLPEFVPDDEIFERKIIDINDFGKFVSWADSPTGLAQIMTLKTHLK